VRLRWADRALRDLEDLLDFIAIDNPAAAQRLYGRVARKTDHLTAFPDFGPICQEAGAPIREILVKPLRLLYLHDEDWVTILGVRREEGEFSLEKSQES
jgi:plasmid stabilization system protein ParE